MKAMLKSTIQIAKNSLDGLPMLDGGSMHILTDAIDGIGYVGTGNRGILQGPDNLAIQFGTRKRFSCKSELGLAISWSGDGTRKLLLAFLF